MADPLVLEIRDRIAYLTLNRPDAMNAINEEIIESGWPLVRQLSENQDIRALVITGAGETFSIGLDIGLLDQAFTDSDYFHGVLLRFRRLLLGIENLPFPVIAAVNGRARAGGFELMLACDLVIIADEARIADHHLSFGIMPGGGSTQRLPRKIGDQRAKELIFTARWIDGVEAVRLGIALRSVPRASLDAEVEVLVAQLRPLSRQCLGATKTAMIEGAPKPIDEATDLEIDHFIRYLNTVPSSREGYNAYKEKREPVWP